MGSPVVYIKYFQNILITCNKESLISNDSRNLSGTKISGTKNSETISNIFMEEYMELKLKDNGIAKVQIKSDIDIS